MQNAYANKIERLNPCEKISFFRHVDELWTRRKCARHPIHRFFTLMRKMKAKSYVREKLELNAELTEEEEMASSRCGGQANITKAIRLTFFGSVPSSRKWEDVEDGRILGYAIVVTLRLPDRSMRTFLHEAVIRTPSISLETKDEFILLEVPNYYVHNARTFQTLLGTKDHNRKFSFEGNYFTQQNDLTSTCGHAALRMAINSSPMLTNLENKIGAKKITNKYINETLGLDFTVPEKTIGHYSSDEPDPKRKEGLTREDMRKVVNSLGQRLFVSNFIEELSVDYDELMYPLVESHCPTILEVHGWDTRENKPYAHALAVMGHTLNSDRWQPEANVGYGNYPVRKYIPVCEWVCHYVISDDNYGMNVTLPSDMIRNDLVPYKNPNLHAVRVMAIIPKQISLPGYAAQKISFDVATAHIKSTRLSRPIYWLKKLKEKEKSHNLVCRTILKSGKAYSCYINTMTNLGFLDPNDEQLNYFQSLPKYIWVTEITIPNLYVGNKAKLADVLVDACATQKAIKDRDCVVMAWFPGFMRSRNKKHSEPWYLKKHVPLIRTGEEPIIEW